MSGPSLPLRYCNSSELMKRPVSDGTKIVFVLVHSARSGSRANPAAVPMRALRKFLRFMVKPLESKIRTKLFIAVQRNKHVVLYGWPEVPRLKLVHRKRQISGRKVHVDFEPFIKYDWRRRNENRLRRRFHSSTFSGVSRMVSTRSSR